MEAAAGSRTVLIVDDQRVVLRVFAQALQRAGYVVHVADSADAALHLLSPRSDDRCDTGRNNGTGAAIRVRALPPSLCGEVFVCPYLAEARSLNTVDICQLKQVVQRPTTARKTRHRRTVSRA